MQGHSSRHWSKAAVRQNGKLLRPPKGVTPNRLTCPCVHMWDLCRPRPSVLRIRKLKVDCVPPENQPRNHSSSRSDERCRRKARRGSTLQSAIAAVDEIESEHD